MPQEPCHPGKDTKPDRVIQSTAGKREPMEVVKQPERAYPAPLFGNYERFKQKSGALMQFLLRN